MAKQFRRLGSFSQVGIGPRPSVLQVDPDYEIGFYVIKEAAGANENRLFSVDLSDEANPAKADFVDALDKGTDDAPLAQTVLDPVNKFIFTRKRDPTGATDGRGVWMISYDASGQMTIVDTYSAIDDGGASSTFEYIGCNPTSHVFYACLASGDTDLPIWFFGYGGGSLSKGAELDPDTGTKFAFITDTQREIALALSQALDQVIHVINVSSSDPPKPLDTLTRSNLYLQEGAVDTERGAFFAYERGSNDLVAFDWDGTSLTETSRVNGYSSLSQPTYVTGRSEAYLTPGSTNPDFVRYDVTDLAALSEISNQEDFPDGTAVNRPRFALYQAGERAFMVDSNEDFVATVDTEVIAGPDKPTCSVDAVGDESADFSSSAYSHPNDVAHQDSKWEVRKQGATDWTASSLVYDSGWTTEDLEAHTASPLPLDEDLEMRVCHRDTNGEFACSDPCPLSTTGEIKSGEGPEGLFFGEENGNRILRFGRAFQDDGNLITAVLESNHIAPAGARGEVVVRSAHLSLEYGTDLRLVLTPIIDGTEVTEARATVNLSARSRIRETIEVALAQDVTDSAGNAVATVGLRGSWLGMKIEATDRIGHGLKVNLESVEYEVEVVREEAESVNVSA